MIKHIVMWKLREFPTKEEKLRTARNLRQKLLEMKKSIKEIKTIEVGINTEKASVSNYDVILITQFAAFEDLQAYKVHPAHQELVEYLQTIRELRVAIDYESTILPEDN
jgi:cellobiose phosphorylase